jgi:hypothetical protein
VLREQFAAVAVLGQSRTEAALFFGAEVTPAGEQLARMLVAEQRVGDERLASADYFLAVCSCAAALPPFLASDAFFVAEDNAVRKRDLRIRELQDELTSRTRWALELRAETQRAARELATLRAKLAAAEGRPAADAQRPQTSAEGLPVGGDVSAPAAEAPVASSSLRPAFPDGHFYSPVIDPDELARERQRIWSGSPVDPPGIDLRAAEQRRLLVSLSAYTGEFDYPWDAPSPWDGISYYEDNGQFAGLDARILFALLRHCRPLRLIEVGCGYTSLLAADVNRRFLDRALRLTCIDPFPPQYLQTPVDGVTELLAEKVQAVPQRLFSELVAGDVLFIDSSHVVKTGSDVVWLFLEVLPRLSPGVLIHVHDVFLPEDYPADWVLGEQRSWSEQYLVQALLCHSSGFEVVFGCNYARLRFPGAVAEACGALYGGGSLWLRRTRGA